MKVEAWFQYLMAALVSLLSYQAYDIREQLEENRKVLMEHLITHPSENLTERVIVLEQQIKTPSLP